NSAIPAPAGVPRTVHSSQFGLGVDLAAGTVTLDGRGWGHGIGLSQYGALGKALRGMTAPNILAAYYGGLRPVVMPARQLPASVQVVLDAGRPAAALLGSGQGPSGPLSGTQFRLLDGGGHPLAV